MPVTISPLSSALGAEIRGADIAAGIDDSTFSAILSTWHDHGLICLRNQSIDEAQQVAFGARFGPLAPWSRFADKVTDAESRKPYIMLITNLKENGEYIGSLAEGEIEMQEGETLDELKARMQAMKPKKPTFTADMLDTANSYDDKVALIRMLVSQESGRVALVLKNMVKS